MWSLSRLPTAQSVPSQQIALKSPIAHQPRDGQLQALIPLLIVLQFHLKLLKGKSRPGFILSAFIFPFLLSDSPDAQGFERHHSNCVTNLHRCRYHYKTPHSHSKGARGSKNAHISGFPVNTSDFCARRDCSPPRFFSYFSFKISLLLFSYFFLRHSEVSL